MLLVFDPGGLLFYRLSDSTVSSRAVVQRWDDLHRFASISECCVVCVRWLDDPDDRRRLAGYRRAFPRQPTVLVVERRAENLPYLERFPGWELVWLADVERRLAAGVARAIEAARPDDLDVPPGGEHAGPTLDLRLGSAWTLMPRPRPDEDQDWGGRLRGP